MLCFLFPFRFVSFPRMRICVTYLFVCLFVVVVVVVVFILSTSYILISHHMLICLVYVSFKVASAKFNLHNKE